MMLESVRFLELRKFSTENFLSVPGKVKSMMHSCVIILNSVVFYFDSSFLALA